VPQAWKGAGRVFTVGKLPINLLIGTITS